jgi:membrane-bound lytic murein transglycosylase D
MFGDWHLALAAYNWGEGNVGRAIARNQRAGLGTKYTDLPMPNETRNYVPKLQAVKNIVANPDSLPRRAAGHREPPVLRHRDGRPRHRRRPGRAAGRHRAGRLQGAQPAINRPVVLAAGTPQILLPWDNAQVFQRNLSDYNQGRFASWTAWTVPGTMSVGEAARRVGMNENELRSVNAIPPRMLIKAGSVLVVRGRVQAGRRGRHVADNGQLSLAPEVTLAPHHGQGRPQRVGGQHRAPLQGAAGAGRRMEQRRVSSSATAHTMMPATKITCV